MVRSRFFLSLAFAGLFGAPLAADDVKKDEPEPPPLFGVTHLPERGAAAYLGASIGPGAPLRQSVILAVGEATSCWEFSSKVLRGEARTPTGVAAVLGASLPGQAAAFAVPLMLDAGEYADCWSLEDYSRVRPLDPFLLRALRDDTPLPSPDEMTPAAVNENFLLHDGLLKVLRAPPEAFDRVAQSALGVEEVEANPWKYRGQVLRFYGQLQRIRELKPPERLRQFGARGLYEVWILVKWRDLRWPVCLLTPVSFGFAPGDSFPAGVEVSVTGYFVKKLRFAPADAVKGLPVNSALLLLGHGGKVLGHEVRAGTAAVAVVSAATDSPLTPALLLRAGERAGHWTIEDPTRVPPLSADLLDAVKDETGMPSSAESKERLAYEQAVVIANRTPLKLFKASLRKEVTFAHMHRHPDDYRGEVVQVSGFLRRVREYKPSLNEMKGGVKAVYEVWIVNNEYGPNNPAALICTSLPEGVEVSEKVEGSVPATLIGYFFKKYQFKAQDAKKEGEFRVAPLLIGHLTLERQSKGSSDSVWTNMLVPFILATLAGTFILVFVMTWAFRRADRRVLARLDASAPPFVAASELNPEPTPGPGVEEKGPDEQGERRIPEP